MSKDELVLELERLIKTPFLTKSDLNSIESIRLILSRKFNWYDDTEYYSKGKQSKFKKSKRVTNFSRNR